MPDLITMGRQVARLATLPRPAIDVGSQGGGAGGAALLRITGTGANPQSYTADVYGNGDLAAATETGVTVRLPMLANTALLPYGDWPIWVVATLRNGVYYGQVPTWF